jgi:hypothetical protein
MSGGTMTDAPWAREGMTSQERAEAVMAWCYDNLDLGDWQMAIAAAIEAHLADARREEQRG